MTAIDPSQDPIVIVGAKRTPMGAFQGDFSTIQAHDLGAAAIKAAVEQSGIAGEQIGEALVGNCLMAGQRQGPARQAVAKAGLPMSCGAVTLSKMCGSGMKTAMMAYDMLVAGTHDVMVAGGMENMTRAPHIILQGRSGIRIGHAQVLDHLMYDGLEDAFDAGTSMGVFGEKCAEKYSFTREEQDAFAIESVRRAQAAIENGSFTAEITPVTVPHRKGDKVIEMDEGPGRINPEKIPQLRAAFKKDGTITAASSSSINDGAAALVLTRQSTADKLGAKVIARVVGHATHSHEPEWFTTAPVGAAQKLLSNIGWAAGDVDLWEVNEAFAAVPMAFMKELGISHDVVNVFGGACALGHPIGASGARIMVTLLNAMQQKGKKKGVATLCIGGGEGVAMAVEMV